MQQVILIVEKENDGDIKVEIDGGVMEVSTAISQVTSEFLNRVEEKAGKEQADILFNAIVESIRSDREE